MSIAIEGTIGAGKTTLMKAHQQLARPNVDYLFEPDEEWCRTNALSNLYTDPKKNAFAFEVTSILRLSEPPLEEHKLVIQERSIFDPYYVFGALQLELGYLNQEEFGMIRHLFETKVSGTKTRGIFYIQIDPSIAFERIRRRGRPGEQHITEHYLNRLCSLHDNLFEGNTSAFDIPVKIVDGNQLTSELILALDEFIKTVDSSDRIQNKPPMVHLTPRSHWTNDWW